MIDLHNHILYGLDDGPDTLEESLEMCRIGYGDGIRTVVATPHMLNGVYRNARTTILAKVRELNTLLLRSEMTASNSELLYGRGYPAPPNSELRILPGADIHLGSEVLHHLKLGRLMTLGDGKKYILAEFPSQGIPYLTEKVLFQCVTQGIIPIITHPERNPEVGRSPMRFFEMIRMGCLGQVTAMSLTGGFGPEVRRLAEKLLLHRLVHVIASDAHSAEGRPPILTPAVQAASKLVNEEEARRMVTEYPRAILEGKKPNLPDPIPF